MQYWGITLSTYYWERLDKLDTLDTLLTKTLARLEKLEAHVNYLDLRVQTLEAKSRSKDNSIGEMKASADFINQKFKDNKALFTDKTMDVFKRQESQIHQLRIKQRSAVWGSQWDRAPVITQLKHSHLVSKLLEKRDKN